MQSALPASRGLVAARRPARHGRLQVAASTAVPAEVN